MHQIIIETYVYKNNEDGRNEAAMLGLADVPHGGVDGRAQINEKRFFINDGKLYTTEHRSPSKDFIKSNDEY